MPHSMEKKDKKGWKYNGMTSETCSTAEDKRRMTILCETVISKCYVDCSLQQLATDTHWVDSIICVVTNKADK